MKTHLLHVLELRLLLSVDTHIQKYGYVLYIFDVKNVSRTEKLIKNQTVTKKTNLLTLVCVFFVCFVVFFVWLFKGFRGILWWVVRRHKLTVDNTFITLFLEFSYSIRQFSFLYNTQLKTDVTKNKMDLFVTKTNEYES